MGAWAWTFLDPFAFDNATVAAYYSDDASTWTANDYSGDQIPAYVQNELLKTRWKTAGSHRYHRLMVDAASGGHTFDSLIIGGVLDIPSATTIAMASDNATWDSNSDFASPTTVFSSENLYPTSRNGYEDGGYGDIVSGRGYDLRGTAPFSFSRFRSFTATSEGYYRLQFDLGSATAMQIGRVTLARMFRTVTIPSYGFGVERIDASSRITGIGGQNIGNRLPTTRAIRGITVHCTQEDYYFNWEPLAARFGTSKPFWMLMDADYADSFSHINVFYAHFTRPPSWSSAYRGSVSFDIAETL